MKQSRSKRSDKIMKYLHREEMFRKYAENKKIVKENRKKEKEENKIKNEL